MPIGSSSSSLFPMARCGNCAKSVLTCLAVDAQGEEHRLCAHCGSPVTEIEWATAGELEAEGYFFDPPVAGAQAPCLSGRCCSRADREALTSAAPSQKNSKPPGKGGRCQ